MTDNRVQIVIATRDESSGAVKAIQGSFDSLATHVTAISFAFNQVKSAVDTVLSAIKPVIDTTLQFEKINAIFTTLTGSAAGAAQEMEFVRGEARRLGLDLTTSAEAYGKFANAAKGTALEGEQTRKIFSGVAEAARAMGLSGEETEGALLALSQMMSKGTVSAEELKGQLGERLSGAFQLAAQSMGMTTQQLNKQLEVGGLMSNDLLPKLAVRMHETYGKAAAEAAKGGASAINNFKNAVTESYNELGKAVMPTIATALNAIAANFSAITTAVEVLAAAGAAVVIGRIGEAAVVSAAQQIQFVRAVVSGNAVLLDSRSVAKAKAQAELEAARAVEAHKIALLDKARAEVIAANATRAVFMITVRKAQANQALAVAEAELAFQSSATTLAKNRYAAAAGRATLASRAAAGAASLLTGAMNMMGGPIGMVVVALGALVWSLKSIDREVKEQYAKRKQEQESAEADARQGVADAKAREDRLVEILGDSTEKQINELKRKTQEKLAQQDLDEKADVDALRKAGFNFDEYLKILAKHRKARAKIIEDGQKAEKELYAKESLANLEDRKKQLKVDEDYFAALGNLRERDRAALDQQYVEALKQVETYYAAQKAKAEESGVSLPALEEQRQKAVFQVQQLYAVKRGLLGEEEKKRALEITTSEGNERIALIRQQIADRVRTEIDGEREIADIQADLAGREYEIAQRNFDQISAVYRRDSKEYIEAHKAKEQALVKLTAAENTITQRAEEERKQQLEKSSLDYRMELHRRLDWLIDSERDGLITCRQAARDKLEAEVTYLRQVADLKARAVRDTTPDSVEYKQALTARYEADREYYEKKQELDRVQVESFRHAVKEQEEAEWRRMEASLERKSRLTEEWEQSLAETSEFAGGFYEQWDRITNEVAALGPKVAAAFHVPLTASLDSAEDLRRKLAEVAEEVLKAGEMARESGLFSRLLGEHAREAEQLTYRYYSQRLAVAELTEQLKTMGQATEYQVRHANNLIKEMDLLDTSDLEGIRSEVDRLTESLKEAEEQAKDTVGSLRDELDEMLGNRTAIEERDYQTKKDELLAKLADAQQAGNLAIVQEYREALTLLEEIHKRKMANIQEEAAAAKKAALESSVSSATAIPGFAGGGRFPGPDSPVDNLIVKVRSGEWGIKNESVRFWESNIGRGFMAGINDPLSAAGRQIWERLTAKAAAWKEYLYIPTPRVGFASGGAFSDAAAFQGQAAAGTPMVVNIYAQRLDEATVRREVLPVFEKVMKLKS